MNEARAKTLIDNVTSCNELSVWGMPGKGASMNGFIGAMRVRNAKQGLTSLKEK